MQNAPRPGHTEDQQSLRGWCIVGKGRTVGSKTRKCVHVEGKDKSKEIIRRQ